LITFFIAFLVRTTNYFLYHHLKADKKEKVLMMI